MPRVIHPTIPYFWKYDGPPFNVRSDEPRAVHGRGAVVRADDPFAALSVEELAAMAKKLGYIEKPAPNSGVRRMRLLNVVRARSKK